jgi:hypothetical protein
MPKLPAPPERKKAPATVQCAAQSGGWDGIGCLALEVSYGATLTGLYPDSPMPSIARQKSSPAFYKPVTFFDFPHPIKQNRLMGWFSLVVLRVLCG